MVELSILDSAEGRGCRADRITVEVRSLVGDLDLEIRVLASLDVSEWIRMLIVESVVDKEV